MSAWKKMVQCCHCLVQHLACDLEVKGDTSVFLTSRIVDSIFKIDIVSWYNCGAAGEVFPCSNVKISTGLFWCSLFRILYQCSFNILVIPVLSNCIYMSRFSDKRNNDFLVLVYIYYFHMLIFRCFLLIVF